MDVFSRIFITSTALASGPYNAGANPGCRKLFFDFRMFNTIYNVPAATSFEFGSGGSYTSIPITAGMYTFATITATMKTGMQAIIADSDIFRDPITNKLVISSPTTPATNIRFVNSSAYLRSLLGVASTTYTGTYITSPNVMKLFPGTGVTVTVSGVTFNSSAYGGGVGYGVIFVPWADVGGLMVNDDNPESRVWVIDRVQNFSSISVTLVDSLGGTVALNGGEFLLTMNLVA